MQYQDSHNEIQKHKHKKKYKQQEISQHKKKKRKDSRSKSHHKNKKNHKISSHHRDNNNNNDNDNRVKIDNSDNRVKIDNNDNRVKIDNSDNNHNNNNNNNNRNIRQQKKSKSKEQKKSISKEKKKSRSRENKHRKKQKDNDKYDRWADRNRRGGGGRDNRNQRDRFRFDSPPKSDESDMSQDPEKMQKLNRMKAAKQLVTSKADRKLYLGNLPPNITSNQLMDMLNTALKKMEIKSPDDMEDSIVSAWISPDGVGHYAFVQFRTAQEATNALTLNGASLYGYQLKLGRPKQYIEYNKQLLSEYGTDSNIDTIISKVQAMGPEQKPIISERIVCVPSRILVLKNIVTVEQLAIDEQYEQIYDDVKDMAVRFGTVLKIVIPRPHQIVDLQEMPKRVKGLGYIFIEYKTIEQAKLARKQFIQKSFSERSVSCSYFSEQNFKEEEYDVIDKVFIDF